MYFLSLVQDVSFDHQEEIDGEVRAEWSEAEQGRGQASPSPFVMRMRASGLL